jgi:hypothetical protein
LAFRRLKVTKASVKRVDSDAYNLLAKRAKAAGLKGQMPRLQLVNL